MKSLFWKIILLLFALGVGGYALSFLDFRPRSILQTKGDLTQQAWYRVLFYTHVLAGGLALIIGGIQWLTLRRQRIHPSHIWLGKGYLIACGLSGVAAVAISFFATGGWIAASGFFLLGVSWLFTTFSGYRMIRLRQVLLHRRWMIRSFALTMAAVTLRIYLPLMLISGLPFERAYLWISWLCWVPNLLVAEWLILPRLAPLPPVYTSASAEN